MKKLIISAALAALLVSPAMAGEWYTGGTLSRANLGQWASASGANRLATAADSVTVLRNHLGKAMVHPDDYKQESRQLVVCLREIAADPATHAVGVSEASSACFIAMGWL